ncbi:hypothetical protein [Streptomyces sp. NPDC054975]
MIIVYTPSDGEPEEFDAKTLKVSEVGIVARTIDQPLSRQRIHTGLSEEDLAVMRGIVWVIKKRSQPSLKFGDFDPGYEEMATRLDRDEVKRWAEATAEVAWQQPDATPETVRAALRLVHVTALDREHAEELIERLAAGPKEDPEAEPNIMPSAPSGTSLASATST